MAVRGAFSLPLDDAIDAFLVIAETAPSEEIGIEVARIATQLEAARRAGADPNLLARDIYQTSAQEGSFDSKPKDAAGPLKWACLKRDGRFHFAAASPPRYTLGELWVTRRFANELIGIDRDQASDLASFLINRLDELAKRKRSGLALRLWHH